jgi:hypothetical protein
MGPAAAPSSGWFKAKSIINSKDTEKKKKREKGNVKFVQKYAWPFRLYPKREM